MASLTELLRRADAQDALPRLGGMARPDGVVIVSERFWAFAGLDGTIRRGEMPRPNRLAAGVPLVRGLVRVAAALTPLFRGGGVARGRERVLLIGAAALPCALVLAPPALANVVGVAIGVALVGWMLRGRTLNLHGAEHRAIAAAEGRQLAATWGGEAAPSRFAPRCGTNLAALAVPITLAGDRLWPLGTTLWSPLVVTLVSLSLTMELWLALEGSRHALARAALAPGLALQRLTTREPRLEETRVALTALADVLERELV